MLESRDEAFSKTEEYRGGNANMHAVEAFLIVYDVTHDKKWLDRAIRVASVIITTSPEIIIIALTNTSVQWNPLPDYNKDNPATASARSRYSGPLDRMGPFNAAHSRGLEARCEQPPAWLLEDAKGLLTPPCVMLGTGWRGRDCLYR
ncbi:AGE family epimerase/isomerase [Escherichia coli]|nr:AGE family epimerase/isomerase [Escherichia coli]